MSRTRNLSRPIRGLLALGLGVALAGCGGEAPEAAPELRPVRTVVVEPTGGGLTRTLAGVARAGVESRLSFRVPGTVDSVAVALGDRVRRGQVLARLDPTDYELRVEEAEAGLAQAESAQAQVETGEKRLQQARQQVGYTSLRAPSDGAIAAVSVEVNENVNAGQQVVLLTAGGEPEIEVAVPEVLIAEVAVGQPVEVRFDALPGRRIAAEITEVGVAVIGGASTYQVVAGITEEVAEVRSGMAAEVTFTFAEGQGERILVPAVAIGEDRDGRFVFVLERGADGTGTVRRRAVEIGEPASGLSGIEILDGVAAGDEVVTAGVRRLTDGMAVKVLAAGPGDGTA